MDGNRKALKERWRQRTDVAFEQMFAGKSGEELRTLAQRENMVMAIGRELAAFLLEEHVSQDAAVKPAEESTTCCPKCGQPGKRAVEKDDKLPEREIHTRAGDISLRRERWQCAKCRVIFFSARCSPGVGDGRVQSRGASESSAAGGESGVV